MKSNQEFKEGMTQSQVMSKLMLDNLNTHATLNSILFNQARILAHLEGRSFDEVKAEVLERAEFNLNKELKSFEENYVFKTPSEE